MPILLTTSRPTGDFDNNGPYTHIKIIKKNNGMLEKVIAICCEYGTVSGGNWISGKHSSDADFKNPEWHYLTDLNGATDYTDARNETAIDGNEKLYDGVARFLYQWLIDKPLYPGTIV